MSKKALKFLAFGDLEAKEEILKRLLDKDLSLYDFILFTGDVPNPEVFRKLGKKMVEEGLGDLGDRPNIARETEPKEALKQIEKEFRTIQGLFKKIQERTRFVGVWGNADNTKILRKVVIEDYIEIIHNKIIRIGELYLIGYNGRPLYIFEKENKEQWAFSEEEIYGGLEMLFEELRGERVILVTHAPPYRILDQVVGDYRKYGVGTYGERAKDGHIGSVGLKKIVDKFKPVLHVCGHIHESRGVFSGETTLVNTGSLGRYEEVVEISLNPGEIEVRFKKI